MQKVLFAIDLRKAEEYIQDSLTKLHPDEYNFVGSAIHKGDLPEKMRLTTPDIVIVREGLSGPEDLFTLVCKLKVSYPKTRFIFIAGDRRPGDANMQKLANFGIFDIVYGQRPNINKILELVINPADFSYGAKFLMSPDERPEGFETNEEKDDNDKLIEEIISTTLIEEDNTQKDKTKKNAGKSGGTLVLPLGEKNNNKSSVDDELLRQVAELQEELDSLKKEQKNKNKQGEVGTSKANAGIKPRPPQVSKDRLFGGGRTIASPQYSGKDKIVTFFGAKNGIGTTTIAYNVAMELAYRRKNVLYIEVNDVNPMIAYWYDVYSTLALNNGIDKAILGFETGINKDIDEALITRAELIKDGGHLAENFKKFPASLDYLFYSAEYIEARNKPIISSNSFSQVLLYFMQQLNYNYLILDINTHTDQSLIETALTFSNKNFIIITQEFSTIGYYQRFFEILRRKGMDFSKKDDGKKDLSDKNSFIINRYVPKASFNLKTIKEWLDNPEVFLVVDNSKDIADLSFNCEPIIKQTTNKDFILNISAIATTIEE